MFPDNWKHGWFNPDHNAVPNRDLKRWLEWREAYYYFCSDDVFGRAPMIEFADHIGNDKGCYSGEFGRVFAPWGLSTDGVPLLHPADAGEFGFRENSVYAFEDND